MADEKVIEAVITDLKTFTEEHKIPHDHGMEHYLTVFNNTNFVSSETRKRISSKRWLAIQLACLLHELDDRKIEELLRSLVGEGPYSLAAWFMKKHAPSLTDEVIEMIDLVAASKNGNSEVKDRDLAIARDCDRLESIGQIGVKRCYEYTLRKGKPLVCPETPLPITRAQLDEVLKQRPIENYIKSGGKSDSMIDHYMDKLLHLRVMSSGDEGLQAEADKRMEYMFQFFFRTTRVLRLIKITTPLYLQEVPEDFFN